MALYIISTGWCVTLQLNEFTYLLKQDTHKQNITLVTSLSVTCIACLQSTGCVFQEPSLALFTGITEKCCIIMALNTSHQS